MIGIEGWVSGRSYGVVERIRGERERERERERMQTLLNCIVQSALSDLHTSAIP